MCHYVNSVTLSIKCSFQWDRNIILMKLSPLAALEVVKMTTPNAASDESQNDEIRPVTKISSKWRHFRFSEHICLFWYPHALTCRRRVEGHGAPYKAPEHRLWRACWQHDMSFMWELLTESWAEMVSQMLANDSLRFQSLAIPTAVFMRMASLARQEAGIAKPSRCGNSMFVNIHFQAKFMLVSRTLIGCQQSCQPIRGQVWTFYMDFNMEFS